MSSPESSQEQSHPEPSHSNPVARTDVHAHVVISEYQALLSRFGMAIPGYTAKSGGAPQPPGPATADTASESEHAIGNRLSLMDAAGVERQILSPTFAPYFDVRDHAVEAARCVNDIHARIVGKHPDRLSSLVALPLPHVDHALAELERGLDELDMTGVSMHCFCLGESITQERFDPIFEALDRRGSVVLLHPCVNGLCSPLVAEWGLSPTAGAAFEDTTAALHLILAQIPHRYPSIKFIVPHFGGALPMLLNRLDNQLGLSVADLPEKPSATARRMFFDTVGHGSVAGLRCAVEAFGDTQILAGSDYPVLLTFESYSETFDYIERAGLPEDSVRRIQSGNAAALFGARAAAAR
jgi:aminocarboxymuconate-semialdehyde decarboxylase